MSPIFYDNSSLYKTQVNGINPVGLVTAAFLANKIGSQHVSVAPLDNFKTVKNRGLLLSHNSFRSLQAAGIDVSSIAVPKTSVRIINANRDSFSVNSEVMWACTYKKLHDIIMRWADFKHVSWVDGEYQKTGDVMGFDCGVSWESNLSLASRKLRNTVPKVHVESCFVDLPASFSEDEVVLFFNKYVHGGYSLLYSTNLDEKTDGYLTARGWDSGMPAGEMLHFQHLLLAMHKVDTHIIEDSFLFQRFPSGIRLSDGKGNVNISDGIGINPAGHSPFNRQIAAAKLGAQLLNHEERCLFPEQFGRIWKQKTVPEAVQGAKIAAYLRSRWGTNMLAQKMKQGKQNKVLESICF